MQHGQKLSERPALGMPDGFDASGIPYLGAGRTETPLFASHRGSYSLPGLPPTALIASVEGAAASDGPDALLWGCVDGRPVLFTAEPGLAAELIGSVSRGEVATAIIEPWQLLLERLD